MAASIVGVFQPEMQNLITDSKILLVGTGGIGCEVLKNLVLTGFTELEIIDLDTIEVSNLNRQFLFNKESVGKPKSLVAKESVLKFNPNVNITAHVDDIMHKKYGPSFFKEFKLVINALDNKKARNHVNRMCITCGIPLIESGTMGYNGQVEFIKKGLSMCYECLPKAEPKSYPMCTIRNTPKEPIHCIIWAKFLFGQLFGLAEEDVSMNENIKSQDSSATIAMSAREWAKINDYDPIMLFTKIFIYDIEYLMSMPILFKDKVIKPLNKSIVDQPRSEYSHIPDTSKLTLSQHITMFLECVENIRQKYKDDIGFLVWDKDNDDFMNFVVSSSNIRSVIFNIPCLSHFDTKSMAGNIVPAIATANAIIAGQIVIHALRILRGKFERCQSVFLRQLPNHKGGVLVKERVLQKPNPNCHVCATEGEIILAADMNTFTVKQLDDLVLRQRLNMVAPDVMLSDGSMIISSDEADELDLYAKLLVDVGIFHGTKLVIEDYFQGFSIKVLFRQKEKTKEEDPEYEILGEIEEAIKTDEGNKGDANNTDIPEDVDDCIIEDLKEGNGAVCDNRDRLENGEEIAITNGDIEIAVTNGENEKEEEMEMANNEDIALETSNQPEENNEDVLALKRKANIEEDVSEAKKSRIDE